MNFYRQTSDFTCGPSAILTAMKLLNPYIQFEEYEEFFIWLESNTVYMGNSHAGCSCYGLANSLTKRKFKTELILNFNYSQDYLFSEWMNNKHEQNVYQAIEDKYFLLYEQTKNKITYQELNFQFFQDILTIDNVAVILKSFEEDRNFGHWVTMYKNNDKIMYFDPLDNKINFVYDNKDFKNNFSYGSNYKQCAIIITT
jgi:hypothetical protein